MFATVKYLKSSVKTVTTFFFTVCVNTKYDIYKPFERFDLYNLKRRLIQCGELSAPIIV